MWLFLVTELRELILLAVSAHFAMNYWVTLFSPFQRHWSRCRPCMWGCSFSAVYRVLHRAVKTDNSKKKSVLQLSWGHSAGKWHSKNCIRLQKQSCLQTALCLPRALQLNLLIVQFSNRSIICPTCFLLLSPFPSPRISKTTANLVPLFWGRELLRDTHSLKCNGNIC